MKVLITSAMLAVALFASAGSALACKSGCDCPHKHHTHHATTHHTKTASR